MTFEFVRNEKQETLIIVLNGQIWKWMESEQLMQSQTKIEGMYSNRAISFGLIVKADRLFLVDEDQEFYCHPLFGHFFYTEERVLLAVCKIKRRKILIILENWTFIRV